MCTRFARTSAVVHLRKALQLFDEHELSPRYNIAPTDETEIIAEINGKRAFHSMIFGLIPRWARDPKIGLSCLNARGETVAEKPAFRDSLKKRRCLIPADGFFEWQREGKTKMPYYIQMKDRIPFVMAGLWDEWVRPGGKAFKTFTVITGEPNKMVGTIHDRMPVILPLEKADVWLDPTVNDPAQVLPLLKPYPAEGMIMTRVSPAMNNSKNKGPECVQPLA